MAEIALRAGVTVDLLNKGELDESMSRHFAEAQAARIRGIRWRRLPAALSGKVASAAIALGEDKGEQVGPDQGYFWSLRRIVVSGLTGGTTPDVVNLTRSGSAGEVLWQFTGNAFYAKFGRMELCLQPGETLGLVNVGNLAATGVITVTGELTEVPAELTGKLG